jgi:hypothetical protein
MCGFLLKPAYLFDSYLESECVGKSISAALPPNLIRTATLRCLRLLSPFKVNIALIFKFTDKVKLFAQSFEHPVFFRE